MSVASSREAQSLVVNGTRIDLIEKGSGPPLLYLHAENGIEPAAAAIDELAKHAHVIAPTHPGYGRSELPKGMRSVDDLSYFYLDLLDRCLDRRRDRGENHRADGAAGDGQCGRRQGRRS
jgi:pimeloyl-ACP methyl ester carboxylesterase